MIDIPLNVWPTAAQQTQMGATFNCMNDSNPSPEPKSPRVTLKLKAGVRKSPPERPLERPQESKTSPVQQPRGKANSKPGAHWSDEYKERMQADMDLLSSR
jgi:hypothetical protein